MRLIDVRHLRRERVIGCWEVGGVLIDPGPESSLQTLIGALGDEAPRAVLLTHIHLDHAGGTGALLRHFGELPVYVHERGAPHLAEPSRLLESARRLYGDDLDRLWGEVIPVPESALHPLRGGEEVLGFEVAYTPGHASHHVCFFHTASGRAFVGDVAGVQIPPSGYLIPPTPPPDIDIESWKQSLDTIRAWQPESLGITHFGTIEEPPPHLERMDDELSRWAERADELSGPEFEHLVRQEIAAGADAETAAALLQAVPPQYQFAGLERYLRKRAAAG